MSGAKAVSRRELLAIAAVAGCFGVFVMLVSVGALPPPGGPKSLHAPLEIVFVVGLVFALAAGALLLQFAAGEPTGNGDLPQNAPPWMRIVQFILVLALFICFAAIGTWIAVGPGEREISTDTPFGSVSAGESVGRMAFGIGAAISWLCVIVLAISGARKLRRNRKL